MISILTYHCLLKESAFMITPSTILNAPRYFLIKKYKIGMIILEAD